MQADTTLIEVKYKFNEILASKNLKCNSVMLSKEQYNSLINDVKRIKTSKKKQSSRDYRIAERYDVLNVEDCEKLIERPSDPSGHVKVYVHSDEIFDILYATHLSIRHGGRDKMMKELNLRYKNITQMQVKIFLNLCEMCRQRQKGDKNEVVVKPIIAPDFNSRCQINLIDYQSQPDGEYKFILVYQDQLTKFIVLKPLMTNQADEVAYNVLDIFLLLGAPCILQSNNTPEFSNRVLFRLQEMWPELKMVLGKPQENESESSLEEVNQEIENMLFNWMNDNNTNKWSEGLRFVQFNKNRSHHFQLKMSPFEALFGRSAKVGLASTSQNTVKTLVNEKILKKQRLEVKEELNNVEDVK